MKDDPSSAAPTDVEALYRNQGRELWAMLYARCCDADLALDALQEAMLRLCRHDGAPIRDARRWILRVGFNWLRDTLSRRRRADSSLPKPDQFAGPSAEPSALASTRELRARVRQALARLRCEDRELLVLRYALDWDSKRIAKHLATTPSAIDMRLSRARRRCARALNATGVSSETL